MVDSLQVLKSNTVTMSMEFLLVRQALARQNLAVLITMNVTLFFLSSKRKPPKVLVCHTSIGSIQHEMDGHSDQRVAMVRNRDTMKSVSMAMSKLYITFDSFTNSSGSNSLTTQQSKFVTFLVRFTFDSPLLIYSFFP